MSSVAPSPVPNGNTGPQSKVIAWTSFVVDTRTSKVYSVANGGHEDYSGNEVDELDLAREDPRWTERLAPTPNAQIVDGSYYNDGRPTSRHSYYGVTFDETNDRIMLFGGSRYSMGSQLPTVDSYNIGANSYSASGTHAGVPSSLIALGAAYAVNPINGDVYGGANFTFHRWNRSTSTWTALSTSGSAYGGEAMSAMDTKRGRILVIGGLNPDHHLYTIASNAWSSITLSGANASNIAFLGQDQTSSGSLVYVPEIDLFLVRAKASGGTVYQVNPTTFEVTTFSTTGGASVPATMNGPYNKFLYVPRLGGVVYVPTYSGNAWFLRLH
jgi:hypothetical protein